MNPERIYLEHLEAIEFVSFAARRRRLNAGAASEEPEEARLPLLAGDHAVISQFEKASFLSDGSQWENRFARSLQSYRRERGSRRQRDAPMTAPGSMTFCPSEETLASFIDRRLDREARRRLIEHMSVCVDCREVVVTAAAFKAGELGIRPEPSVARNGC